ncbi:uncharacterized protein L969DRAFT_18395 [Mixia osmundae IAM 14324]|uniref:N-acetyltransferase domain-containing protein n=1 Tax=Mixia osmundae (strain CBS 9802 / IAM 14324 / JCM 22182 / KY 12970) TaxID=764103 RepID=G7E7G8_MIXOS|nr:uncharacterized protein L969DRAFT_18395 [Mixia osmundae IAM 14324]KEI38381.1 hypothetical protein L969DRAFT_18395 [Mixia osmundae IAM 14324]GAA98778.1 hypothetical protein E5Q_05466 [Mixia osmundae IAM 14324]
MGRFELREAEPRDIPALLGLIRELAEYERMPEMVKATPELLQRNIFERHFGSAVVAVDTRNASRVVGMALWTTTFSTWTGKPSLYLEDLYVQPEARKHGLGKALFGWLGKKCRELDCARLEWVVLKWNEPSIKFYEALGATTMKDWDTMRLEGTALADLEKLLPS